MRRRSLLAGLSASIGALAGCSTIFRGSTETPTITPVDLPTHSPTETPADPDDNDEGGLVEASIIDLKTANRTYALAPLQYRSDDGAGIRLRFSSTATTQRPAIAEASLTNENTFENTFRLEWTPPFGRLTSDIPHPVGKYSGNDTYRASLVFVPTKNHDLVDDSPEFERGADGYWRLSGDTSPDLPEQIRLAPDETVNGEYAVVGHAEGAGNGRPPGVYEFSRAGKRSVRVTVWKTDAPGPATASRFEGVSVPVLPGESETAWFHDAEASTPTFVRPRIERMSLPARVTFTFLNRSREPTRCGHWDLYKLQDDEWFHLGPYVQTADCKVVSPGDAKTWVMRAAPGQMAPCKARSFAFLGGGRYAAVTGYGHATRRSGALVEFDAPDVTVAPTNDVTAERQDGSVTATSQRWQTAPDEDHRSRVHLVLERKADAEQTFIAEQVMRRWFRGLRNTLAFVAPDIERVVLRTDDRIADRVLGYDDGTLRFWYDGQAYVLSMSRR